MGTKKLRPQKNRKPKENYSVSQLKTDVAREVGFTRRDTEKVINEVWVQIGKAIMEKQTVYLPNIGILFPCVTPPKKAVALRDEFDNPEKIVIPAKWRLRIQPHSVFQNKLAETEVTKKELEDCYYEVKKD